MCTEYMYVYFAHVFCTVCKYVLSICKLLCFFLHCLEHARKNFTHQGTCAVVNVTIKSDLIWFDLICASRLPRITAQMRPLELITVALVKSMLIFIPIDMYILYQPRRGTFRRIPESRGLTNPVASLLVWFSTAWRMEQNVCRSRKG